MTFQKIEQHPVAWFCCIVLTISLIGMSRSRSPQRPLACYENWLRARGVSWDQRLQLQTPEMGSISGWGLRSSERIPKGEKLIQVPPAAALTARASIMEGQSVLDLLKEGQLEEFTSFDETSDCQLPLAVAFILADKSWWPKLRKEVTPRHCDLAWNWSSPMAGTLLLGTDLEKVVAAKQRRISEEFEKLKSAMKKTFATITLEQYTSACAVIMSRIQPWWGGSLVPFVDQANHDQKPHIEFRLRQGKVEARSIRVIEPGEVFQSYGELSAADSLYRYGFTEFASKASDIVVSYADVVTLSLKDLAEGDENFSHRAAELKALNLLEESPWDGLEDVGIGALPQSSSQERRRWYQRSSSLLGRLCHCQAQWGCLAGSLDICQSQGCLDCFRSSTITWCWLGTCLTCVEAVPQGAGAPQSTTRKLEGGRGFVWWGCWKEGGSHPFRIATAASCGS